MTRILLVLAFAALVLPAAALSKGPSAADVNGPGSGGGITFKGGGEWGGSALANLTEQAGFFPAVFPQKPDPMLRSRPNGNLGPKYTITYTVPGPYGETFTVHQDVYPYATPDPVTYMKPGQKIFRIPGGTRGGWFQASAQLKQTLVRAGLPKVAPSGSSSDDGFLSTEMLSVLVAALLLAAATAAVVLRRRTRPAPAA